jgi:predicted amidophosphoribosyltransferase
VNGLITPRPGPGVCPDCFNLSRGPESCRCRACCASPSHLDVIVPISYAPAGGRLHRELADYKRAAEPAVPDLVLTLAGLLSRFLARHEACVAAAGGVERFDAVMVVPSGDAWRDTMHPLRHMVSTLVPETRGRFDDNLRASGAGCVRHAFDVDRFVTSAPVDGRHVLLIDDVWTTGATAQSAAAVLRASGAASVSAVVIGRYVNGYWGGISERLKRLLAAETNGGCVLCEQPTRSLAASYTRDSPPGGRSSVG